MDDQTPDWIAANRLPVEPGWYWVWTGIPSDGVAPARIDRDALGNWTLSCGAAVGSLAVMSDRFLWRWSRPIPGPGRT